jgi:Glyoxalase/Bleomycin resistance protein/Dioxygenase superfamily
MDHPNNRLSHAIYCVAPEDFDDCVAYWTESLGVQLDVVELPAEVNIRVVFSLEHGIEIVSPTGPNAPQAMRDFVEQKGNGIYSLVYSVPDLEVAVDRALARGGTVTDRFSYTGIPPWSETYKVMEEAVLAPVHGMNVVLAQIELL